MRKEFLDFLYEQRSVVNTDIARLEEQQKQPRSAECSKCGDETKAELKISRLRIEGINKGIEKYLELHKS